MAGFSSKAERMQRLVVGVIVLLVIVAVAVIGIGESNDSPQNVFWAAIQNGMSTTAVTITTTGKQSGETEQAVCQLDFGQNPASRVVTTLASSNATAITETLTTRTAEYTRYDYIHKKGKSTSFSNVIGLWTKTSSFKEQLVPPTFAETLLDEPLPTPLGNLTSSERGSLLSQIQDSQIYSVNFSSVQKTSYNGRTAYVYKVAIQPVLYLQLLKTYAPELGMQQLNSVNPNAYDDEAAISATWTIDAKSKQLVKANYGDGRVESYGGWGVPINIATPTHTVTAAYLQNQLDKEL